MSIGGINIEAEIVGRDENYPPGTPTNIFCQICSHHFSVGESLRVFCEAAKGTAKKHCQECVSRLEIPAPSKLSAKTIYPSQPDRQNGCA